MNEWLEFLCLIGIIIPNVITNWMCLLICQLSLCHLWFGVVWCGVHKVCLGCLGVYTMHTPSSHPTTNTCIDCLGVCILFPLPPPTPSSHSFLPLTFNPPTLTSPPPNTHTSSSCSSNTMFFNNTGTSLGKNGLNTAGSICASQNAIQNSHDSNATPSSPSCVHRNMYSIMPPIWDSSLSGWSVRSCTRPVHTALRTSLEPSYARLKRPWIYLCVVGGGGVGWGGMVGNDSMVTS